MDGLTIRMEAALPSPRRSRRLLAVLVGLALGLGLVVLVLLLPDRGPRPAAYVVVRGDTLGRIAEVHGVTVAQLM
jgi:cell division septal protein FtsQ